MTCSGKNPGHCARAQLIRLLRYVNSRKSTDVMSNDLLSLQRSDSFKIFTHRMFNAVQTPQRVNDRVSGAQLAHACSCHRFTDWWGPSVHGNACPLLFDTRVYHQCHSNYSSQSLQFLQPNCDADLADMRKPIIVISSIDQYGLRIFDLDGVTYRLQATIEFEKKYPL